MDDTIQHVIVNSMPTKIHMLIYTIHPWPVCNTLNINFVNETRIKTTSLSHSNINQLTFICMHINLPIYYNRYEKIKAHNVIWLDNMYS